MKIVSLYKPVPLIKRKLSEIEPACKNCKFYVNKHQNVYLNECSKFKRIHNRLEFAEVCNFVECKTLFLNKNKINVKVK